ncbi:unnamed protein product [Linum trigynum]|uniref:Bifunctional inhibitor/plant lipid transfer protein/seed storage helical domain-containing protein n=1 Tax=Linum trigynum TaxID=586398 RepID=A0AAV2EZF9_9ROSI
MTKFWLAAVGLAFLLTSITPEQSFYATAADQTYCNGDLNALMSQCWKYVQSSGGKKVPPSAGCCAAMKPVDVPCACAYITKAIEGYVSMDRVVYAARSCGKALAPGTKCGSYTVPPQ